MKIKDKDFAVGLSGMALGVVCILLFLASLPYDSSNMSEEDAISYDSRIIAGATTLQKPVDPEAWLEGQLNVGYHSPQAPIHIKIPAHFNVRQTSGISLEMPDLDYDEITIGAPVPKLRFVEGLAPERLALITVPEGDWRRVREMTVEVEGKVLTCARWVETDGR